MHTKESVLTHPFPDILYRMHFRSAAVRRMYGEEAGRFIDRFVDVGSHTVEVIATSTAFNITAMNGKAVRSIVNMKRMNDIEKVNEFLANVNRKLPHKGLYIGCVETIEQRRRRILNKYPKAISQLYYLLDFMLKRVFPKWGPTRKIYRLLTRGNNRAMSLTETLGRLRVCGFRIEEYAEVGNLTYFVVRKIARPVQETDERYGMVIRLRRVGRGGELFNVYKFRTMHPYAEFLQDFLYTMYDLRNGDKITDDFRITSWGRILRKFWLDEQPMWINWLRGDVKLVGVRPLSHQKLSLYPEEYRKRRVHYTPGLIPPFYADLPKSLDELITSEVKYLDSYDRNPWFTDIRYFWKSVYNIALRGARSG